MVHPSALPIPIQSDHMVASEIPVEFLEVLSAGI